MVCQAGFVHRRDPEGIFSEPVMDDIAPGYSAIIKIPMDLTTVASKVDSELYSSLQEFKVSWECSRPLKCIAKLPDNSEVWLRQF